MKPLRKFTCLSLALASLLLLSLVIAGATPARAAGEDVAMFYDSLAPYGSWVDYGNYGPVWYPTQGVTQNWRPYLDGRWVPTSDGWTFESSEPWAWATYHFGNWMPSTDYGWVWSPGSTWYPSTAAWRTNDDYVGWAPIPPPDYVPEPAYYPSGGYYPNEPAMDLLSAPFWIFAQAANFLLGFNQPYGPAYSYYNTGYLAPYSYSPYLFANTLFLNDFFYPSFAPNAFFAFGPPFPFVSRVTNINITNINNFVTVNNFNRIHNGLPPRAVFDRHPFFRDAVPASVRENGRFNARRVANPASVGRRLANPTAIKAPGNVPRLTHEIPKGATPAAQPAARRGGGVRPEAASPGAVRPGAVTPGERAPRAVTPRGGEAAPRAVTPRGGEAAPRGAAPRVETAPGREAPSRAPARELRTPTTRPPTREFRAPVREQAPTRAPAREFRAPSRGTTLPPPSTHEITPRQQQQIRQFRPSAPAPRTAPSAPAPRMAPSAPAPRMAPSAPAPRPSAPAPAARPSAPAPAQRPSAPAPAPAQRPSGGGGPQQHH